jgi:hypothetical protein
MQIHREALMKFAVLFEDNPSAGNDIRHTHMPAHLAFLEKYSTNVLAAGPLKTSEGEGAGGLWLVEAADSSEVDALIKEDPFWPTGLRRSARIFEWRPVFADGRRLIPG